MNVMTKAHQMVKALIAKLSPKARYVGQYAQMLKLALKEAHKEFKTMQKEISPLEAWKAEAINVAEKRITELKSIENKDGFIVVVGDSIRLPLEEVQGSWCKVERASIFWHREDAQRFAGRVRNGSNEVGMVAKKIDQIEWEISEQQKLIESLKNSF